MENLTMDKKYEKEKKSDILDEFIENEQFELLKSILAFGNKMNFDYLEVADKLLCHDIERKNGNDEAFELFLWLDLKQCDYENNKFNDWEDSLDLDIHLQDYVAFKKYDRVSSLLNMPKITFKKDNICIEDLFYLWQQDKITWKREYDEYFKTKSLKEELKVICMKSDDEAKTGCVYLNQDVAKNNKSLVINKKQFIIAINNDVKHDEIALNLFMRRELRVLEGDTVDVDFSSGDIEIYVQPQNINAPKEINYIEMENLTKSDLRWIRDTIENVANTPMCDDRKQSVLNNVVRFIDEKTTTKED